MGEWGRDGFCRHWLAVGAFVSILTRTGRSGTIEISGKSPTNVLPEEKSMKWISIGSKLF
jgi:hypothetical protein